MRFPEGVADGARRLLDEVRRYQGPPVNVMEVCGTHTVAIARMGLRGLLPEGVRFLSGPGCPVCVTPVTLFDEAIHLVREEGAILATYGDAIRVPGTQTTLARARAEGGRVEVVYAATDALALAEAHPDRPVVFLGLGFETTSPTVAHLLAVARRRGIGNLSLLSAHKRLLPAMEALLADPGVEIGAFLCPGHASMVLGASAFRPIVEAHRVPCAVAGFEPEDVLLGLLHLLRQVEAGEARVENLYPRAVTERGNPKALRMLDEVFVPADAAWRGLGTLPMSGLVPGPEWEEYDARRRFPALAALAEGREPAGCRCADVLRGRIEPAACPLFGTACTPEQPVGACMVSGEGACGAHHRYRGE